ncbi:MAG: ATP-grasp domain-containing protein [Bacteroidota bacterium]
MIPLWTMMPKSSFSILIPDGENLLLMHVVNCLASCSGASIHVICSERKKPMRFSRLIQSFSFYPPTDRPEDWISTINKEVEKNEIDFIMPIGESGIQKIITYQHLILDARNKLVLLPSLQEFDTALDKGLLSQHLLSYGLPGPLSVVVSTTSDLEKVDQLTFPVISKPAIGFGGGEHIHVFKDRTACKTFFSQNGILCKQIIQEYIEGFDIDCSILSKEGVILASTIQKGNSWAKNKFQPANGLKFLDEPRLYKVVKVLVESLNWSGIAHIDLRYDTKDGQFKVIEINPRYWLSVEASLIAGVNFPQLHCLASKGELFKKPGYTHVDFLSLEGLKQKVREQKHILFRWKFIVNHTPIQFVLKDPMPILYRSISMRLKNWAK